MLAPAENRTFEPAVSSRDLRAPFLGDVFLVAATLLLVGFGLLMVYSTTGVMAQEKYHDSFFFLKRQFAAAIIGLVFLTILSRIDIELIHKYSAYFLPLSLLLLLLPRIPGLGTSSGGAERWINLYFFRFQPAEFAKLFFIMFFAGYLARHENYLHTFKEGVVKPLLLLVPVAVILLGQPDFGSTAVVCLVVVIMAATTGVRLKYVGLACLMLLLAGAALVVISPYRMGRVLSFLSPWADASGRGYQLIQSLIAVGIGEVFGVGLGASQQKLFFLPAAHTDFIFAVIAEELGFIGALALIVAFLVYLWRGYLLSGRLADDTFSFALSVGLTSSIVVPAFLNIGVVTGLLPTKGLVLPFVAYGGSSLVASLVTVGLLLALARSFQRRVV